MEATSLAMQVVTDGGGTGTSQTLAGFLQLTSGCGQRIRLGLWRSV